MFMDSIANALQSLANMIFSLIPQPKPSDQALKETKIIAHRGDPNSHGVRENTLKAFSACLGGKIWGIEFDIRWTKDDIPVVHHDVCTERVFGKNLVISQISFKELRSEIPEIPSLQEVVDQFARELHLMIELKTDLSANQRLKLQKVLSPLDPIVDFHFMSLDTERFNQLSDYPKDCFATIATTNMGSVFRRTIEMEHGALTGHYLLLTASRKNLCHTKAIKAGTGFIDSKYLAYREINRGIDWLFTNKANEIAKYL